MSELIIVKVEKNRNYKTVGLQAVQDDNLSWKAKGLHLYLISRPDGWKIRAKDLLNKSKDGQQSLYNGLKELEEFHYLKRVRIVEKMTKRIKGMMYKVFEKPYQGNPHVDQTHVENHDIYYKEDINNKYTSFNNKEDSLSSLRKEDKESKSGICCQTSDSVNPPPRPSLDTASKDVLATADNEVLEKENNKSLAKEHTPIKNNRPTKDDSILPWKKLPAKQLEYEHASDEARSLVEDWNELTTTPIHKKESKIVRRALQLLDGKLLKEHTPKEIFRTMFDFSTMQKDAGNYRVPAGKVNIDDFFIGNGYLNGVRERKGETVEPPWFQRLVLPGSFAKYLRREDPDPDVTKEFKHRYRRHILADQGVSFSPRQESQFREASKRLREFMKKGRLEKFLDNVSYGDYIRWLLEALIGKYKKVTEIEVGHLCSEYTWNDLFPKFIAYNWEE